MPIMKNEPRPVPKAAPEPDQAREQPVDPYPDSPIESSLLSFKVQDPDNPDAPWKDAFDDRIFITLQTGGEKYHIHAVDHEGVISADVSQATFEANRRVRREMTEIDIQTVRDSMLDALPKNQGLREALERPNGLRDFLLIEQPS